MDRRQSAAPPLLVRNLDYHLLVCFDVLMTECHVTRAADKLELSQPSMSGILAKLRETFGDPLLVRSSRGMVPTPRALELHEIVRSVRRLLEDAMRGAPPFDPAKAKTTFKLILSDYAQVMLLPRVAGILQAEAPGVTLDIKPANTRRIGEFLEAGEIDLGIGYIPDPPEFLRSRELFREQFVCLVRRGCAARARDAAAFARERHLLVAPGGASHFGMLLDRALLKLNMHRQAPMVIPNYVVAPFIVAESDLIAFLPKRVATIFAGYLPVDMFDPPVEVPHYSVSMFWHEGRHHDLSHQWLRQTFVKARDEIDQALVVQRPSGKTSAAGRTPARRRPARAAAQSSS